MAPNILNGRVGAGLRFLQCRYVRGVKDCTSKTCWCTPASLRTYASLSDRYTANGNKVGEPFRTPYIRLDLNRNHDKSSRQSEEEAGILRLKLNGTNSTPTIKYQRGDLIRMKFWSGLKPYERAYSPLWLRDHCQCQECVHPDTKQRLLDSFSIPVDIRPDLVQPGNEGATIVWNEGHKSFYTWEWLGRHPARVKKRPEAIEESRILHGRHNEEDVTVPYESIMTSDSGVARWTSAIYRFGYCFVDGCPVTPEATEELLQRIAFIRNTHYGAFWDFTSDLTMKDTAYTSLALNAHTDTTYFTEPAGLQMFHLLSHTEGDGGASLLVDGFRAAEILKKESELAYGMLSSQPIPWHASGNETISIQPTHSVPVLEQFRHATHAQPELFRVRWNNDDRATKDDWPTFSTCAQWYAAARLWASILKRSNMEIWEQLRPGRPLSKFVHIVLDSVQESTKE